MISDQLGGLLHGRSSRGEALSSMETEQLEAWYASEVMRLPNWGQIGAEMPADLIIFKARTYSELTFPIGVCPTMRNWMI